jgi:hypothetical protein
MQFISKLFENAAYITVMGPTAHPPRKDCPDNIEQLQTACKKLRILELNANTIPRRYLKLPK